MSADFTLKKFYELCDATKNNYSAITVAEYLSGQYQERFVIMRHDVDRKPKNSLKTAKIEHELGIKSTYYFRFNDNAFGPDIVQIIQDIEDMGHEIGYHYETLGKTKGDYDRAIKLFKYELGEFRKICGIKTISMHGGPLSKYDNRDLWNVHNFKDFKILGEAYLSINKDVNYFTDTGRSWNSKNNVRDFMPNVIPGKNGNEAVNTTDDMIDMIKSNKINKLYILTHPERWSSNNTEWCCNYMKDFIFNTGKKILLTVGR